MKIYVLVPVAGFAITLAFVFSCGTAIAADASAMVPVSTATVASFTQAENTPWG